MALKVIEGGGEPPDYDAPAAVAAFKMLSIEILRAIVRGDDIEGRVERQLKKLFDHLERTRERPERLVDQAIRDLHASIDTDPDSDFRDDLESVVAASLQLAAESCCTDNAARGRASKRRDTLRTRIEIMTERRTRGQRPRSKDGSKWDDVE